MLTCIIFNLVIDRHNFFNFKFGIIVVKHLLTLSLSL
jgi:hypothetical protein